MDEIASVSIETEPFLIEVLALFCLVLVVGLVVALKLEGTVGKFTPLSVGAESHFHELTAKLRFFFGILRVQVRTAMARFLGKRSWVGSQFMGLVDCRGALFVFAEAECHRL